MPSAHGAHIKYMMQQQPDAVLTQVNPVSGTYYTVLPATEDVRLISAAAYLTWAVTQPTPLYIRVTVDGVVIDHLFNNPVSLTGYELAETPDNPEANQYLLSSSAVRKRTAPFSFEGHNVTVKVMITWAVTQPTPLVCRVKYARLLPT